MIELVDVTQIIKKDEGVYLLSFLSWAGISEDRFSWVLVLSGLGAYILLQMRKTGW